MSHQTQPIQVRKLRGAFEELLRDAGVPADPDDQAPDVVSGTLFLHRECLGPSVYARRVEDDGVEEAAAAE